MTDRKYAYGLALLLFAVDQLSKWIMMVPLQLWKLQNGIEVLPIFRFNFVANRGISLGLFQADSDAGRWALVAATAAIAVGVAWWITREEQRGDQLALAAIMGGAMGNIVDRVRLGYVVDFLDLHFGEWRPFYVFNVADAAISIGVVILLIRAFLSRDKAPEGMNENA